jgi:hypothetical protein
LSHNVTLRRPLPPLTCDVIYGWPLIIIIDVVIIMPEWKRRPIE